MDMNRLTRSRRRCTTQTGPSASATARSTASICSRFVDQPGGLTPLSQAGADMEELQAELEAELARRPRVSGPGAAPGQVFLTQRLARLLDAADAHARRLKDDYVSVEHLVLALLDEGSSTAAGRLLAAQGLSPDAFLQALTKIRGNQRVTDVPEATYEALSKYAAICQRARTGKMDPVIGGTPRSAGSYRSCRARRRTIPSHR
jgi:ATP-dependent Clp protease ATP-binding subunit ClpB